VDGSDRSAPIAGTDFSFEDLEARDTGEYEVDAWSESVHNGRPSIVVRGRPKYESRYKIIEWTIDVEQGVFSRIRNLDEAGRPIKTLLIDLASIQTHGELSIPHEFGMKTEAGNTETLVRLPHVFLDPAFKLGLFTTSSLESRKRIPLLPR
jgi:hypothetical protein